MPFLYYANANMANFPPFRNYLFYCLDQIINKYELKPPFLDMGCGTGYFSQFLGRRGWHGTAIDSSPEAFEEAQRRLLGCPLVVVEMKNLTEEKAKYKSIFLLDILEHIDDDRGALKKASSLLDRDGFLTLAVPSNPHRWGWDDDFYGHVRRYTLPELEKKLSEAGLKIVMAWDFTYPFFTFLRWLHLKISSRHQADIKLDSAQQTSQSGIMPEWQKSFGSRFLTKLSFAWQPLYWIMFTFFKSNVLRGHEMIVLARLIK